MARNVLRVRRNSTKNNKLELEFKNAENIVFAHESEKEFAKILDFYRIKWEYEPKTFTLEWDENDIPVLSFTPDFYLSELDLDKKSKGTLSRDQCKALLQKRL